MDREASCDVKTASSNPKTPINSISSLDSDSTLSEEEEEEEVIIITLSPTPKSVDSISFNSVLVSDEEIVESIYQNLLSLFLSLQILTVSEILCLDGCKTPPSRLTDSKLVPDTCPGAPMKLGKISRKIDPGLRRKLF